MSNPKNLGLPCLLPVQVRSEDGSRSRGFVTRLGKVTACISSAPELITGALVELTIRRPADNQTVTLSGTVASHLTEGGLWRGRSAALVSLASELDDNFLGTEAKQTADVSGIPLRRGSEPRAKRPYLAGRGATAPLISGLGRRKRGSSAAKKGTPKAANQVPASALESAELNAPLPLRLQAEAIASAELSPPSAEGIEAPLPPPVHTTEEHIAAVTDSNIDFAAIAASAEAGGLSALSDGGEAPPLSIPEGPIVLDQRPADEDASPDISPPVKDSSEFWDEDSWTSDDSIDALHDSLIPRAARIPSGVPVHFWTQGQRLEATAGNFSAEGMFLAYEGDAPARGGTVRVEFAVGDTRPNAAIRFSAEVRWHHSDRPDSDLPEGFGVQILEFETRGDEERYSKLLLYLLAIQAPQTRDEG